MGWLARWLRRDSRENATAKEPSAPAAMTIAVGPGAACFTPPGGRSFLIVFDAASFVAHATAMPAAAAVLIASGPADGASRRALAGHVGLDPEAVATLPWLAAQKRRGAFIDRAGWSGFHPLTGRPAALIDIGDGDAHLIVGEALDAATLAAAAPLRVRWLAGPLSPSPASPADLNTATMQLAFDGAVAVTPTPADACGSGLTLATALAALGIPVERTRA